MKTIIALALAMVLLFGCSGEGSGGTGNNATVAAIKNTTAAYAPEGNGAPNPAPTQNTTGVMMADYKFPTLPPRPQFDFSNVTTPNGTLIVYYFHSTRCSACQAIQPTVDLLKTRYPDVVWFDYDINTQDGRYAYNDFAAWMNLTPKQELVPQALVNGTLITDRFHINDTLEGVIKNFTMR